MGIHFASPGAYEIFRWFFSQDFKDVRKEPGSVCSEECEQTTGKTPDFGQLSARYRLPFIYIK
jgi:hypothetical protein